MTDSTSAFCSQCGAAQSANARFCAECGAKRTPATTAIDSEPQVPSPAQASETLAQPILPPPPPPQGAPQNAPTLLPPPAAPASASTVVPAPTAALITPTPTPTSSFVPSVPSRSAAYPTGSVPVAAKAKSNRGLVITAIALAGVLVLGGVGAAIGWAVSGGNDQASLPAATVVVTAEPEVEPEETTEPEEEGDGDTSGEVDPPGTTQESVKPVFESKEFKSPSGNIRCAIGMYSDQPGVVCQLNKVNFGTPNGACNAGGQGVFVGLDAANGAYWPCIPYNIQPAAIQPLDVPISHAGVTCVINQVTGVTCRNDKGNGFTMEYDRGVQLF